jgi:hypothetical protein
MASFRSKKGGKKDCIAVCTYRVMRGKEDAFRQLVMKHYPALRALELVEEQPHLVLAGRDEADGCVVVEILHWSRPDGPMMAEEIPEVIAIWERMGQLVESRGNRPAMEFPLMTLLSS